MVAQSGNFFHFFGIDLPSPSFSSYHLSFSIVSVGGKLGEEGRVSGCAE